MSKLSLLVRMSGVVLLVLLSSWPVRGGVLDSTGDTFGSGTIFDITSLSADPSSGPPQIIFTVNFADPISAPSAFASNSVFGYIDIDTDQNSATGGFAPWGGPVTGGNSWINYFILPNAGTPSIPGPLISLGDEFYLDLSTEQFQMGLVDVIRTLDSTVVGTAPISFGNSSFAVAVSLSLLGGDDGLLNFGLLMGNIDAATDRAPDGTDPATVTRDSAVPEPGSLAICLTGTAGLVAGYLRRRRKHLQPTGS